MSCSQDEITYFLDSNIWLYALIQSQNINKHAIANQVVRANRIFISTQVINEVCINLIRKASFSEEQIYALITAFYQTYTVVELGVDILLKASELRSRYLLSFWDSQIVASALYAGAKILVSEDM